jgi:hypothetical protein
MTPSEFRDKMVQIGSTTGLLREMAINLMRDALAEAGYEAGTAEWDEMEFQRVSALNNEFEAWVQDKRK